eukprot:CAMPEP_0115684762 /NCGR_PEP_ID=MMETSP0272-20121206/59097_1 /TAXON_ID=71861 /ORGANISM="Scrippsiella trochoidea, Strain CCMP3099" /LENGTH=192 /DNA_ID=CAMNT_0003124299 /DNA_START=107 /DNA_END=681 /DNA_ORIENTATION=+
MPFSGADLAAAIAAQSTHHRVIYQDGGHDALEGAMQTSSQASQDLSQLLRATRRQSQPARRRFARCRPLPEDECAALRCCREAQEDEWRRILRQQRGSSFAGSSTGSWAITAVPAGRQQDDAFPHTPRSSSGAPFASGSSAAASAIGSGGAGLTAADATATSRAAGRRGHSKALESKPLPSSGRSCAGNSLA